MVSFCEIFLNELKQDSLFPKLVYHLEKILITEENDLILKLNELMNYQIIYKTDDKINFEHMTYNEKVKFIVKIICQMTDLDPNKSFCDWSTEMMPIKVPKEIVISFINKSDFTAIFSNLNGYKSIQEILEIISNF